MCEPVTLGAIALGVGAVGSGMSIASKFQAAAYQNKVDKINARLARIQAGQVRQEGVNQAAQAVAEGGAVAGSALTQMQGSNIDTTTGTPSNIFAMSGINAAQDAAAARANAERQAWGLENESNQLLANARFRRQSTILGGVAEGIGAAGNLGFSAAQLRMQSKLYGG